MVNGTDLVVFLAQKVRALSSLISPHTDRARETLRGGKAAASLAKPLLGKRGEIAPLSAPPHTRLYSKEDPSPFFFLLFYQNLRLSLVLVYPVIFGPLPLFFLTFYICYIIRHIWTNFILD